MEYAVALILIVSILIFVVNYRARIIIDRYQIGYRKQKRNDYGYIYFYRGRNENPFRVKIGRTNNWNNRLSSARTSVSPHGIKILGATIVKDDIKAENTVFKRFHKERIRKDRKNEWFHLSPRLYLFMRRVRNDKVTSEAKAKLEWK